jgi:polyketide synthase PksN
MDGSAGLVIHGDIGDPRQLTLDMSQAGVDPGQVLHIRSFLDHDRPYSEPTDRGSLAARQSGRYLGAYADRKGGAVCAAAVVQSLVEHLRRWAQIANAHGLVILEVHCQDPRAVPLMRNIFRARRADLRPRNRSRSRVEAQVGL